MRFIGYIGLLFCVSLTQAHAGEVHLQWAPVKGATAYEFEVTRNEKDAIKKKVAPDKTEWAVVLPTGVYTFRMRAIDWYGQAGHWSQAEQLLSPPPPPEAVSASPQQVKWKPVSDATKYRMQIARPGSIVLTEDTAVTTFTPKNLPDGLYAARVASVLEAAQQSAVGIPSRWVRFRVGKPEAPPKEWFELSHSFVSLLPITSFYQITGTDLSDNGATGSVVSNLNLGFHLEAGVSINDNWSIRARYEILQTSLQPLPSDPDSKISADGGSNTLSTFDISLGFRPAFASRLEVRLLFGAGQSRKVSLVANPLNSDALIVTLNPIAFSRLGGGFGLGLFRLFTFNLGLEGSILAIGSKGVSYNAMATAERSLWGRMRIRGFMGFGSTSLSDPSLPITWNEFSMGGGIEYRFGD